VGVVADVDGLDLGHELSPLRTRNRCTSKASILVSPVTSRDRMCSFTSDKRHKSLPVSPTLGATTTCNDLIFRGVRRPAAPRLASSQPIHVVIHAKAGISVSVRQPTRPPPRPHQRPSTPQSKRATSRWPFRILAARLRLGLGARFRVRTLARGD